MADAIRQRVRGLSAWNFTTEERNTIKQKYVNGEGTWYLFADGSKGFVAKGSASFCLYITSKRWKAEKAA